MSLRLSVLLLASLPVVAQAQTSLPPDIDPVTLSRLPPVTPQDLDEEGRKLLAARPDFKAGPGPAHVTIYSPRERTLGIPTGDNSPVGAAVFSARGADHRAGDRPAIRMVRARAGGSAAGARAIGDRRRQARPDVTGLSDKDATLITFGRTLYREHRVSSELWAKMIGHFGRQHTVQLMMIMGDYFSVGFMMNAVDQHLPPTREALLPPLKR